MHRREPSCWMPPGQPLDRSFGAARRPDGAALDPEADATIAVPLAHAETLPCPRLALALPEDDPPTLRTSPEELAVLLRLMQPLGPRPPLPTAPPSLPIRHPAAAPIRSSDFGRTPPVPQEPLALAVARVKPERADRRSLAPFSSRSVADRLPQPRSVQSAAGCGFVGGAGGPGAMMPTQLWLGGPAATVHRQARPPRRESLWTRLWTLLGFAAPVPRRTQAPPCRPRHRPR